MIKEEEFVTKELVLDPLCMNIATGGHPSGFFSRNQQNATIAGNKSSNRDHTAIINKALKTKRERGSGNFFGSKHDTFLGKKHSDSTKNKISQTHKTLQIGVGIRNSQYGIKRVGICKDGKIKKVLQEHLQEFLDCGWKRGFR